MRKTPEQRAFDLTGVQDMPGDCVPKSALGRMRAVAAEIKAAERAERIDCAEVAERIGRELGEAAVGWGIAEAIRKQER
jgi:hypothetical protein